MASKTGWHVIRNEFKHLIFSDTHLTENTCTRVFNDLLRDVNQVSRILFDTTALAMLFSNFDKYAERISQFFKQVDGSAQARGNVYFEPGLPGALISGFLLRLLDDGFNQFLMEPSYHDVFGSIINFCLTFRSAHLEMLAEALGEKGQLLELLVSGENNGQVMREWAHAFDTDSPSFKSDVFAAWVKRLVALCGCCEGNHLVSEQSDNWQKLQGLIDRLAEVQSSFASAPEIPPRVVTQEDKDLLGDFGITPPISEGALWIVLEQLQRNETVKVLRVLADSFPCRTCYRAFTGEGFQQNAGPLSFSGLFGANLGIWRICISAQALKDLRQSQSEGKSQKVLEFVWKFTYVGIYRHLRSNPS